MEIDLSAARETVRQLAERLEALDGRTVDPAPTREGSRQRTEVSRTLQHLAHLGDKASVEIMEVFYDFRGWDRPGGK
ncbi:hypothetical protein [Streptomyces melanosporofaciens]|uniref:Uncharacterized protein n=1 Tax=Streptomyces melanosporofaciens TaxID=67327 RepID=A0A1H4KND1_STRMJ|nr:hypothetical protein [Streptomyces melanosporofaciens]SEB60044.1 hypothetical protein SAMN04490356_0864 [Streptomyces melanosporofaciens]